MKVAEILTAECCPGLATSIVEDADIILEAEYQGKTVQLNSPKRGGPKKFYVFVKNNEGRVIKVTFGDPNATIKNDDVKAAASFQARHRCAQQKDKTSAAYWSCNVARYAKQLGLSSSRPW